MQALINGLGSESRYVVTANRKGSPGQPRVLRGEQARMAVQAWNK